ncbi:hypothetical protein GmHk_01G002920 [Glycine max]|nr:hypothetical protein GmHk_01G002920 [Glycine max]
MAAAALLELDRVLKSKKEMLTPREANILLSWKSKSLMDLAAGALGGTAAAGAVYHSYSRLSSVRMTITIIPSLQQLGNSMDYFEYAFQQDLVLTVDRGCLIDPRILMQIRFLQWMDAFDRNDNEELLLLSRGVFRIALSLTTFLIWEEKLGTVTKYQNDPLLMRLISKHLYLERIFDDSTSNNPTLRWRYRNFFSDNAVNGHRTHDRESNDKSQGRSENVTDSKRTNLKTKRTFKNASPDIMSEGDPLDCLLVMLLRWKRSIIQISQINHQEYIIGLVENLTVGVGCIIMRTFQTLSLQQLFDYHLTFADVDVRIMQIVVFLIT